MDGADFAQSPAETSPDRALVFELKSSVQNFLTAARDLGLEWLGEDYPDVDPDESMEEQAEASDEGAAEILYVTMPTLAGLQKLLSLWRRFSEGQQPPDGARPWWTLFGYLIDIRPWSAKDRVDPTVASYVDRMLEEFPDRPVRLELDLWFRADPELRAQAATYVAALMELVGGRVLDFATIEPIRYQAALIELSGGQARQLAGLGGPLADANQVMRVRPQAMFEAVPREPLADGGNQRPVPDRFDGRPPVAALIDGYPVQNHELLANRVSVHEVDVEGGLVPVARRFHGTGMASLILHGDLGSNEPPSDRRLIAVPILAAPQALSTETTPTDRLPINLVYRAVLALVEGLDGVPAVGERVVVINHSVCDREAPFARRPSYWAKLLDYLAHRYRLLFIVSAGNVNEPFELDAYEDCDDFEAADNIERQIVLLRSIESAKGLRLILSPAESLNALTVGAVHADSSQGCPSGHIDPFAAIGVTNIGSGVGLGVNRAIKPDIVEAGGRQLVKTATELGVVSAWAHDHPEIGQLAAMPDPAAGTTTKVGRSSGTSNAAALITRAAVRLIDTAETLFEDDGEDWGEAGTRAVVLKALLTHSCTWGSIGDLLNTTYPGGWQRKREAISRFLGYGQPSHGRLLSADGSRITLLADDIIKANVLHEYRVPIPRAMVNNREVRRITMTLAWSSPIEPTSQRYRGMLVEMVDADGKRDFWHGVKTTLQPTAYAGRRGTLQHLVLEGKNKITSVREGNIFVGVQARADLARFASDEVPYALAVTLELAQPLRQDLFEDVVTRVRTKRVPVREQAPIRVRTS